MVFLLIEIVGIMCDRDRILYAFHRYPKKDKKSKRTKYSLIWRRGGQVFSIFKMACGYCKLRRQIGGQTDMLKSLKNLMPIKNTPTWWGL